MEKNLTSFSDLSTEATCLDNYDNGLSLAKVHLNRSIEYGNLVIACNPGQKISQDFWRGYLSFSKRRFRKLNKLDLVDLNEDSALNLALVLSDFKIQPRQVFWNGDSVE